MVIEVEFFGSWNLKIHSSDHNTALLLAICGIIADIPIFILAFLGIKPLFIVAVHIDSTAVGFNDR